MVLACAWQPAAVQAEGSCCGSWGLCTGALPALWACRGCRVRLVLMGACLLPAYVHELR